MHDVLIDRKGNRLGDVEFEIGEIWCSGKLSNMNLPPELMKLFYDFEELVNIQAFRPLDAIEARVETWGLRLEQLGGNIEDVQLMNDGDFCFKLKG